MAEDNPVNQEVARTALERRGHSVTVVEDGHSAVAAAAREDFDILLMDLQMPGMDGLKACALIRGLHGPRSRVPIIAVTANATLSIERECLAAGMNGHMTKPYRPESLVGLVEKAATSPVVEQRSEPIAFDGELLDRDVLDGLVRDLGAETTRSLVAMHLRHAGGLEGKIAEAIAAGNAMPLSRAFHQLKSASATIGFARAAVIAADAEGAAEAGDVAGIERLYARFKAAMSLSEAATRSLLPTDEPSA